jgi:hypothetical protein
MSQSSQSQERKGKRITKVGFIILTLSVFPIISILFQIVMRSILRPETDSTQIAIVNIVSLLSIPVGIIAGAILIFVGLRLQKRVNNL